MVLPTLCYDSLVGRYSNLKQHASCCCPNSAIIIQLGVVVCKDIILHRAATPNSCKRDILVAMNVRNQQITLLAQNSIQSTMVVRLQLSESRDKLSDLKKHPRTSKLFMIV